MRDLLKANFDKILLSSLFLIGIALFVFLIYHVDTVEAGVVQWLEQIIGQILAALLTLSVGRALASSATATPSGAVTLATGEAATKPPAPDVKQ